jgi:hypothetical protein
MRKTADERPIFRRQEDTLPLDRISRLWRDPWKKEKARAAFASALARTSPYAVNRPNADGDPHRTVRQPAQVRTARADSLSRSAIGACEITHTDHRSSRAEGDSPE